MDEALKRRLTGALVVIVALFIVSLLLPHPGTVPSDNDNKRVTLDLSGKDESTTPAPATSTPVPPVIAAPSGDKPASKPEETLASNASAAMDAKANRLSLVAKIITPHNRNRPRSVDRWG